MCVRVRMCVCVCTSVCALGILPPPPPPTGGSDQPSDWFARPRPKAARPRAHADRADSPRPQHYFPGGQGGSGGTAAPRGRHTPPNDREEESSALGALPVLSLSGWPPLSPAAQPAMGRLAPRIPAPRISQAEREVSGKGTQRPTSPCLGQKKRGRSPPRGSCRRLGAPRAGPGPRQLSARLGAPGARAAGHAVGAGGAERVRRCGSGPLPPPLLLPPVSARRGLSSPSRSSPHATD